MAEDDAQASAALDRSRVARLIETLGEGGLALVGELVATFLDESPAMVAGLRQAVSSGAAADARRAAHTLKSNGNDLGALGLAAVCREVESRAAAGDLTAAAALLDELEREHRRAVTALQALAGDLTRGKV